MCGLSACGCDAKPGRDRRQRTRSHHQVGQRSVRTTASEITAGTVAQRAILIGWFQGWFFPIWQVELPRLNGTESRISAMRAEVRG